MAPNENSNELKSDVAAKTLKLPEWLNVGYIKELLILDNKPNWKYVDHEVKMANEKGENYASVLYRVKVTAKNEESDVKNFSYILKVNPVMEGPMKELMEVFNVFGKEVEMYRSVVPDFLKIFEDCGEIVDFSPKCLKTSTPEVEQIILEDLSQSGYKMASRHDGLDMDHVKLVIERLAKFHAASAVLEEKKGPYPAPLLEGMFNVKLKPMMESFFRVNLEIFKETIGKMKQGERYLKKMENYLEKSFDKSIQVAKANPNGFNVLNHGDLWTNNLMFKYDEKEQVEDMLFIDLQMSVWGSPAVDLHYFIISSTQKHLKINEYDTIIQFYHENLVEWLDKLGYKKQVPTLLELHLDLLERGFLGLMASITVLPITLLRECEDADINNMLDEGDAGMNFKRKLYTNPAYADIMEMLMIHFDKKGILTI